MGSGESKVMTAAEAVADITDGASLGVAGFGVSHRYPSTLITALRDAGPGGLTVYCNGLGQPGFPTAHMLADNHQIGHLVTCFSARPGVVSEAEKQIEAGEMTLEMVPGGPHGEPGLPGRVAELQCVVRQGAPGDDRRGRGDRADRGDRGRRRRSSRGVRDAGGAGDGADGREEPADAGEPAGRLGPTVPGQARADAGGDRAEGSPPR